MSLMFDQLAERFARETDLALQQNGYLRGTLILDFARRALAAGDTVLDYGCGPGRLSLLLARAGFRVRAVDISAGMIAQAQMLDREGLDLKFETISTSTEALQSQSCDAIVCSSVIEYVPDPDWLLREFHRALRKPGVLIISYANKTSLWRRRWEQDENHSNPMYTPQNHVWNWRGFHALLARNGFRTTMRPRFFESPCDWKPWGRLLRRVSLVGSLGVVAARPVPIEPSR